MDLAELNRRVTSAIFRAERLADGSWESQAAYRDVSVLEEAIAGQTGAADVEGAIAREGAVRAALRAGECLRALSLATRYLEEDGVPSHLRMALEELQRKADEALPDGSADVTPARMAA
jgi:TPR repeat protein